MFNCPFVILRVFKKGSQSFVNLSGFFFVVVRFGPQEHLHTTLLKESNMMPNASSTCCDMWTVGFDAKVIRPL